MVPIFSDILVTKVYDNEGNFSYLELHQDNQVLKLSLADNSIDVQTHSYKWKVLRSIIDKMQQECMDELVASLGIETAWKEDITGEVNTGDDS